MKARIHYDDYSQILLQKRTSAINAMKKTWGEFRNDLANNKFTYDDTTKALETCFLKQFNDLFTNSGKDYLSTDLDTIFSEYHIGRGTILSKDEAVSYSRFLPIAKYIKDDNRFSPPQVEWLYLAIGETDSDIQHCAEFECKASKGERFGFCNFNLNDDFKTIKIIDLTKYAEKSQDEIDAELQLLADSILETSVHEIKVSKNYSVQNQQFVSNKYKPELYNGGVLWLIRTYSTMLNENIFKPVRIENKSFEYTPFQALAKYFEIKGFGGIIYKSTVYSKAKNLVLFNKYSAIPTGLIQDYYVR